MNSLIQRANGMETLFENTKDKFFGRGIDDILQYDFFNSLDTNIREEADGYRLEIAVPGMRRKDIRLQIEGSMMTVTAQKQRRKQLWRTLEFNNSMLQRSFALPKDSDKNAIEAKCRDGLLTIKIGKLKGTYRTITIQGEQLNEKFSDSVNSRWLRIKNRIANLLNREQMSEG
jgi:HSP20 family protein